MLTVSDTCSNTPSLDASGPSAVQLIESYSPRFTVALRDCVPDDPRRIHSTVMHWIETGLVHVVITLGGTGLSPRDRTPDTLLSMIQPEHRLLGFEHALYAESFKHTPMASLSRLVVGVSNKIILIALPGSARATSQCIPIVLKTVAHAVNQLRGMDLLVENIHVPSYKTLDLLDSGTKTKFEPVNRPRQSQFPMLSVEQAQSKMLELASRLRESLRPEAVYYTNAIDRVLACTLKSRHIVPPFDASIMDGYAVRIADGVGRRRVLGTLCAGDSNSLDDCDTHPLQLSPNTCVRVSTGGPIPPGADAVVPVENTKLLSATDWSSTGDPPDEAVVEITVSPSKKGEFIRPTGFDLNKSDVFKSGLHLGPADVGILASAGLLSPWPDPSTEMLLDDPHTCLPQTVMKCLFQGGFIPCMGQPRVTILSTGEELIDCLHPHSPSSILDSNRVTLMTLLRKCNVSHVRDGGIVGDSVEQLKEAFTNSFHSSDVIITTGGVSMGERDLVKQVLTDLFGATIHFGRIFMKPGKPTTFASLSYPQNGPEENLKLILCLPGNPASVFVTTHLFVIPLMRILQSSPDSRDWIAPRLRVKLLHKVRLSDRPDYRRARLVWETSSSSASVPCARCDHVGSQMSSRLGGCADSNLLLILPPHSDDQTELAPDSSVDAVVIDSL